MYATSIIKQAAGMGTIPDEWKDLKDNESLAQNLGKGVDTTLGAVGNALRQWPASLVGAGGGLWAGTDGRKLLSEYLKRGTGTARPRQASKWFADTRGAAKGAKNPFEFLAAMKLDRAGSKGATRAAASKFFSGGFGKTLVHNPLKGKAKAVAAILGALAASTTVAKLKD